MFVPIPPSAPKRENYEADADFERAVQFHKKWERAFYSSPFEFLGGVAAIIILFIMLAYGVISDAPSVLVPLGFVAIIAGMVSGNICFRLASRWSEDV